MNKREDYTNTILEMLERSKNLLVEKQKEYAPDDDPLKNFKEGAKMSGLTPEQVLFMYCTKYMVSVRDIVFGDVPASKERLAEKTGDIINYMIILNALYREESE